MPSVRSPPPPTLPEILITSSPEQREQVHQLPVGSPPTPLPQPSPQLSSNSLELHIPIPIPTPPTPLPIVVAYPLSAGPVTPVPELPQLDRPHYSKRDTIRTDDSGVELEPVPAPALARRLRMERSVDSEETLRDMPMPPQENDYELVDMTDEERLDAQTVYLFRALNVPLNIHKLRAMHAKGRLPAPLLKFRHGPSFRSKRMRSTGGPGEKENMHLTSILKTPGTASHGYDSRSDDPNPESPTDMETVQGESWYLPSATTRIMSRQRSRFSDEEQVEREQERDATRNWESPYTYTYPREIRQVEIPAPQPIIPNQTLLDQFPLPPSSFPSAISQSESYTNTYPYTYSYSTPVPLPIPTPPTPTPSTPRSPGGRPLGYMYAKPLRRSPSCKSCGGGGGGGSSPFGSVPSSRAMTPAAPPPPPFGSKGQGQGQAYYAYDLLTPSPGAVTYSVTGHGSARSVSSPAYHTSLTPTPVSQRYFS